VEKKNKGGHRKIDQRECKGEKESHLGEKKTWELQVEIILTKTHCEVTDTWGLNTQEGGEVEEVAGE